MVRLFVYGTLRHPPVLGALLGRVPDHAAATARGYRAAPLRGRPYPGLVPDPASVVPGLVLEVDDGELSVLDHFEGAEYTRTELTVTRLDDGSAVWAQAWLLTGPSRRHAEPGAWDLERFVALHADRFIGASTPGDVHPSAGSDGRP